MLTEERPCEDTGCRQAKEASGETHPAGPGSWTSSLQNCGCVSSPLCHVLSWWWPKLATSLCTCCSLCSQALACLAPGPNSSLSVTSSKTCPDPLI